MSNEKKELYDIINWDKVCKEIVFHQEDLQKTVSYIFWEHLKGNHFRQKKFISKLRKEFNDYFDEIEKAIDNGKYDN
jgi:hypothetical protein